MERWGYDERPKCRRMQDESGSNMASKRRAVFLPKCYLLCYECWLHTCHGKSHTTRCISFQISINICCSSRPDSFSLITRRSSSGLWNYVVFYVVTKVSMGRLVTINKFTHTASQSKRSRPAFWPRRNIVMIIFIAYISITAIEQF
jgi:hypothetical protein